jgi:hypothetical protein
MYNIMISFCICISSLVHVDHNFSKGKYIKIQDDSLSTIAKEFLSAKLKSCQERSTREDVEAFLKFCADSVQYDHILSPGRKFSFNGKDQWREGALSHLGETRNARIEVVKYIERQNIVILEYDLYRDIKTNADWKADSKRTNVTILEFDKNKKIMRLTDYL